MMPIDVAHSLLTAVIPTRNRPQNLAGQTRLLLRTPYPVIVVDSSDPETAANVRKSIPTAVDYRAHPPEANLYDKLAAVLPTIETPFVLLASDRKITFPHAVDLLVAHLISHPDYIGAQGYILGFGIHGDTIDINRVIWFTPTIGEDEPMQRHYHLMRRYQSWAFGVFRTAPLITALRQARTVEGAMFQEILLMNALVLQGKLARLPTILSLQSNERSLHAPKRNDPFFWFLDDIGSFFSHYLLYRRALTRFITELRISSHSKPDLDQLVDMIHAVWLHYNFDAGIMNHAARLLLGDLLEPIAPPDPTARWREPATADVVSSGKRQYVWRREVIEAEPKKEIQISAREMQRVMSQLDTYYGG